MMNSAPWIYLYCQRYSVAYDLTFLFCFGKKLNRLKKLLSGYLLKALSSGIKL